MLKGVLLVGAILAVAAAPAFADPSCGNPPMAPAVPSGSDIAGKAPDDAHKIVLDTLHSVKAYQGSLGMFRSCLMAQSNAAKAAKAEADAKADKAKADAATQQLADLQKMYDRSVDTETQVVTDYSNLHVAYCKMGANLTGCVAAPAH